MDAPCRYEIVVKGHLDARWADWLNVLTLIQLPTGETQLVGEFPDQSALHGVLTRIGNLGLTLVRVERQEK